MFSDMTEMLGEENPDRIAVIDNTSGSSLHLNFPTLLGSIRYLLYVFRYHYPSGILRI